MNNIPPRKMMRNFPSSALQLMDIGYYDIGGSTTEVRIMHYIYNHPACTASSIAKHLHMHRSSVGRILSFLENEDIIIRSRYDGDHRIYILHLTEKGLTKTEVMMNTAKDAVGAKIAALNEIDRNRLMEAFNTIQSILKQ